MLDERSTKKVSQKEENYFSTWIEPFQVKEFKRSMQPTIDAFRKWEEEGYEVEIDITDSFDSDYIGEKDVVKVLIVLSAVKEESGVELKT